MSCLSSLNGLVVFHRLIEALLLRSQRARVRVSKKEVSVESAWWIVMHADLKTSARCRAVFDAWVAGMRAL
jgi:hypothetical protein